MTKYFAVAILTLCSVVAQGATLKTTNKGLVIEAGSLGEYILEYPKLCDAAQQPLRKLVETQATGQTATLKYEGGGSIEVKLGADGNVTWTFANIPSDVKNLQWETLIDIAFSKGGKWKIGDKDGLFPREKPATPHLFSGHATKTQITNAQGQSLTLQVPDFSFVQLTDNREWNWPIFAWKSVRPFNADEKTLTFVITEDKSASGKKLVDTLGQTTLETWPSKMASVDELRADLEKDKTYYASLTAPNWDQYGGFPESGKRFGLKKTGFFHVEKRENQWWLVDPAGNAFFHTGICGFNPSDDFTYVKGREDIYEWLPTIQSEFSSAFREGDASNFSFHVANSIRKFGEPFTLDTYAARMIDRVRKWGFNSIGSFSEIPSTAATKANFPYVLSLAINEWEGIPRIPGVHETMDPFDENVRTLVKQNLAKTLPARANDPLLIGYFVINEPRFDVLPNVIPSLNGSHACKRRLVETLRDKYKTIEAYNTAWSANAKTFEELNNVGLAVTTSAAKQDVKTFTGLFLETYLALVSETFREYDKNHLLMGMRLQPITIDDEQLCRISGKYLDVMSFNYYTYDIDKDFLKRIHDWTGGLPMMLSEFFWSSPKDSGLTGGREMGSQQERGLAYRNYVEQSAALGFVIGVEWFTLVDQAATGRWFSKYSGESANTGLISVTDRPWKPMLEEMTKTNLTIEEVLLKKRPPFAWKKPESAK